MNFFVCSYQTDEVIREGNNLTMTVATLNTTMMQLLASLDGTIKTSIQTSQENQASIEGLLDQARVAMVSIELALINSYNGLSSGKIVKIFTDSHCFVVILIKVFVLPPVRQRFPISFNLPLSICLSLSLATLWSITQNNFWG